MLSAGKYLGVLAAVDSIKRVGATAVMLTPVTLSGPGLGPFHRAPYSFFAPEVAFASQQGVTAAADELRQLIKDLHKEGIEVYLQVRFSVRSCAFLGYVGWSHTQGLSSAQREISYDASLYLWYPKSVARSNA